MTRLMAWVWRYIPGLHPGMEYLIAQAEGKPFPEVQEHLGRCRRCGNIAGLMRIAMASGQQTGVSGEDRIAKLLRETYESLQLRMTTKQDHSHRLLNALEFYFGEEIARQVNDSAGDGVLASDTKPVFAAFLGRKAADALVQQIVGALT